MTFLKRDECCWINVHQTHIHCITAFFKDDTCVKTKKTYHTAQLIYHETTSTIFSNDEGSKHNVDDRMEHSRYHTNNLILSVSTILSLHKTIFL